MEKSESIKHLAKALADFQGKVGKLPKDTTNPFFKSKYCSLSTILSAIQKPLEECGLTFSQLPDGNNGLTTILMHGESGEYLQSTYDMHPVKQDPQGVGSAITYARRYALGAILGLNIDDDDDGNAASMPNKDSKPIKKANLTGAQFSKLLERIASGEPNVIEKAKEAFDISAEQLKKLEDAKNLLG